MDGVFARILGVGRRSQSVQNCAFERWFHDRSCTAAGHLDGRNATGIVTTRRGFAVRVAAAQYDTAVKLVYPKESERLLGKRWEISGLPLSIGESALIDFLYN